MNLIDRLQLAWTRRQQAKAIRRRGWTGVYVGDYHPPALYEPPEAGEAQA